MLKQFTISAIAVLIMLAGCSDSEKGSQKKAEALIAKTGYALRGIDGSSYEVTKAGTAFTITGAKEPVIVYDIFATWCPPCRAEAPHLSRLQKQFEGKVKVIGISIEEGMDDAHYQRFADDNDAHYTLVNSPDNQRLSRAMAGAIGIGQDFPIPLMVVYKNGRFVKYYSGLVPEEMLASDLSQLTKEN